MACAGSSPLSRRVPRLKSEENFRLSAKTAGSDLGSEQGIGGGPSVQSLASEMALGVRVEKAAIATWKLRPRS